MLGCWQVNHLSPTRSTTNPGRTTAPTTAKNQRQPLPAPLILETPKPSTNPTTTKAAIQTASFVSPSRPFSTTMPGIKTPTSLLQHDAFAAHVLYSHIERTFKENRWRIILLVQTREEMVLAEEPLRGTQIRGPFLGMTIAADKGLTSGAYNLYWEAVWKRCQVGLLLMALASRIRLP